LQTIFGSRTEFGSLTEVLLYCGLDLGVFWNCTE